MDQKSQHYTVLARRFRPQTFDDVVGQQPVAQALKNAISGERVAHAYLFTGARGVGKTSMARILAKALNCPHTRDGIPCNSCEICEGITSGQDVDVLEIDGASNNGVDDVRQLRANVSVKSMRTRYKMYIIDEVHMLSKGAFNALLKTLEEPPPNVVFVFCTTEPNKVPDTIRSRCQRFDFSTIETTRIAERLAQIAQAEGYQVDPEAVEIVARRAAGSMRDSQSLFDQLLAFGSEHIVAEDVHRLLGTATDERLLEIFESLIAGQTAETLSGFDLALRDGVQVGEFIDQLMNYCRDLLVTAAGAGSVPLLSVSESRRGELEAQASRWGMTSILAASEILAECKGRLRQFVFARVLGEMALVRLAMLGQLQGLDSLISTLRNGTGGVQVVNPSKGAGPQAPIQRPSAGEPQRLDSSRESEPAQKKNPEPAEEAREASSSARSEVIQVPLEPGRESDFLREMVAQLKDMLSQHLKAVTRTAIFGPNRLVLTFPAGYTFSREYCERPEMLRRLESQAAAIAGRQVQIGFETEVDESSASAEVGAPAKERVDARKARIRIPENDSFLRGALDLFEAKVVKVEAAVMPQSTGEEHV